MNGNMFDELRDLLEERGELSQDAVNRLTLSALAEVSKKLDINMDEFAKRFMNHVEIEETRNKGVLELRDSVEDLSEAVTLLSQSVVDLKKEINEMKNDVDTIQDDMKENPLVALGKYIKSKPRQALLWGAGVFVVVYLVMGFRLLSLLVVIIGSVFGIPQETIEWILNWMSK